MVPFSNPHPTASGKLEGVDTMAHAFSYSRMDEGLRIVTVAHCPMMGSLKPILVQKPQKN
jgi:hypothetical protein